MGLLLVYRAGYHFIGPRVHRLPTLGIHLSQELDAYCDRTAGTLMQQLILAAGGQTETARHAAGHLVRRACGSALGSPRAALLSRVKVNITVKNAVYGCPGPLHTAFLAVNLTFTLKSGAALMACLLARQGRGLGLVTMLRAVPFLVRSRKVCCELISHTHGVPKREIDR